MGIEVVLSVLLIITSVILGVSLAFLIREAKRKSEEAERRLASVEKEIEVRKKEAELQIKEQIYKIRSEVEQENREKRKDIQRQEQRLIKKEEDLNHRLAALEKKEREISAREQEIQRLREEISRLHAQQRAELQRIAGLSAEQAKQILLKSLEEEARQEAAQMLRRIEEEAKEEAEKKAQKIIALAIQRCAVDQVKESTVSVVPLPGDEMKGRIIGREGRNIRSFESLTGVDLIIDDTPEAVVISSFDPVRREVARKSLENLIMNGRIHPGRIEEIVEKAKREIENEIKQTGERVCLEVGVTGLHPELVRMLGSLKFRTSYSQNVLQHSVEVSHLMGIMAAELNGNIALAKRAGLLHDIGKAVDHRVEGPHASIGADIARRYREPEEVVHAIAAHHGEEEPRTVEAVLVGVADAISASRPGARGETLESYIKRLEQLEKLSDSFPGVAKAYAIQAGREIRVIVKPEEVDDAATYKLAKDIVKKIQESLEYPGQIKVTVLRETRAVEYAK